MDESNYKIMLLKLKLISKEAANKANLLKIIKNREILLNDKIILDKAILDFATIFTLDEKYLY